jgi:type IX secretion system PorP/SprF family membrane protein
MRRNLIILAIFLGGAVFSQDIHYTQIQQTQMLLNPSYTGMFHGWERVGVAHRSQWISAGTKFHTTSVAADMNFFKPKRGNKAYMGAGIQFYNDIGGDSKFGTRQFLMNLSGIVPVTEMQSLAAGLQFGFGQRSGDLSALTFSNQFNGTEINPSLPDNEVNNMTTFLYPDLGFGVSYRYGNHKIGFARDNAFELRLGFSYFHVNQPDLKYRLGYQEKLYGKLGFNGSFLKDFPGSKLGIEVLANQWIQGPHLETMLGVLARYRLSSGSKTTGLTRDSYLRFGMYYRHRDAIAPAVFVHYKGFDFGFSYDVTISQLGQVMRSGGFEFSLVFTNMDFALFKRRR